MRKHAAISLLPLVLLAWVGTAYAAHVIGPMIFLYDETPYAGHGVAADEALVFNVEMQPPDVSELSRIAVFSRTTRQFIGELPPVDRPFWYMPMNILIEEYSGNWYSTTGTVLVLEVGMMDPSFARLIRYSYSYSPWQGFQSTVVDVGEVPMVTSGPGNLPNGAALPIALDIVIVTTPGGDKRILLSDPLIGAIWGTPASDLNQWELLLIADELGATPMTMVCDYEGGQIIGFCGYARGPNWIIEPYVQAMWQPAPGVDLMPGSFGMTFVGKTGNVLFNNSGTGTIYEIDATLLINTSLLPFAPDKPLSVLVEPLPGVSDIQGSLVWDRWHPETEWVYWQRTWSDEESGYWPIYRANVFTGDVEYVAESVYLFDHPSMMTTIPPRWGEPFTLLVASNTQERNMSSTNVLVTQSQLVGPSVVTETQIYIPYDEL